MRGLLIQILIISMLIEARQIYFPEPEILPADFGLERDRVDAFRRVFKKNDWCDCRANGRLIDL